jgi:WD40 repeat protein
LIRRFSIPIWAARDLDSFSSDGRIILTQGSSAVYLWGAQSGKRLLEWPGHEGFITALAYLPDGRSLLTSSSDETTRIWDIATSRSQRQLPFSASEMRLLPGSVLTNTPPGSITVRDLETGKIQRRFALEEQPEKAQEGNRMKEFSYSARLLGVSPDGKTLTAYSRKQVTGKADALQYHVWDFTTGRLLLHRPDAFGFWPDSFSPDGKLAAGRFRKPEEIKMRPIGHEWDLDCALILDVMKGRPILALPEDISTFSPDSQTLLSQYREIFFEKNAPAISPPRFGKHILHLWELRSGRERLTIPGEISGSQSRYERITFSPDGRILATARQDETIQLWNLATGKELLRRSGYDSPVECLAFSRDRKTLATGHQDSTTLVWDIAEAWRAITSKPSPYIKDPEAWWDDLARTPAQQAHMAIWALAGTPEQTVPLLRDRLKPAVVPAPDQVRALLRALESKETKIREGASKQLTEIAEDVETVLEEALKATTSAEQRKRIEALQDAQRIVPAGDKLRHLRGVEVLEHIGNDDAKQVLLSLAKGSPEARLTKEAKGSLERLAMQTTKAQ